MNQPVLVHVEDGICEITLNRPEKRNALSPELIGELHRISDKIAPDPAVQAVIISGAGQAFCAGADLAYLREISDYSEAENLQDSRNLADLFHKIYQLPKLTIAMLNGPALAGGSGLALCCDYAFAAEAEASFGFSEVRIGFVPAIVMNFLIRRVPPATAFHLAVSGEILSAAEALSLGLIHRVFPGNVLKEETFKFAARLRRRNSFQAMMQTKKLFQELLDLPLPDGLQAAARVNALSRKSDDCRKGLQAFLNKRKINWEE